MSTMRLKRKRGRLILLAICFLVSSLIFFMPSNRDLMWPPLGEEMTKIMQVRFAQNFGPGINDSKAPKILINITELRTRNSELMNEAIVNPFPYQFVHNPVKACYNKRVELLLAVPVSRASFQKRHVIRTTWGIYAKEPANNAVLLFFLGSHAGSETPTYQSSIDRESSKYSDIVQGQFLDTYRNLSIKTMSILKWVDAYCSHAVFLTKADDDVYVVMPNLVDILRKIRTVLDQHPFIFGRKWFSKRPIRLKRYKWQVTKKEYREPFFPPFISGPSYSMSGKTAGLLYQAALRAPPLWLEDVYITGVCSKMAGVSLIHNPLIKTMNYRPTACVLRTQTIGFNLLEKHIHRIHRHIQDNDLICPNQDPESNLQ